MSQGYFVVSVRLLEDEKVEEINVPEDASGKWLFEEICCQQGVMQEREYFGLRYLEHEMLSSPTKRWIDLTRNLSSQLKHTYPRQVSFRVKHYPADPLVDLRLPKSHYLLYHQLRRDLISGRLVVQTDVLVRLAALVVQVELGDISAQEPLETSVKNDKHQYLREFRVLHNQTERLESLIIKEHEKLENFLPSEAASELIHLASSLDTYGIDPIRVKTKAYGSRHIHLGLTHQGVAEFIGNRRQKLYPWSAISWMTCNGRDFVVATSYQHPGRKKKTTTTIHYKCDNKSVAQALWEWASDRQLFFTLDKSSSVKPVKSRKTLFQRTRTFTFSGRCRREVIGRPLLTTSLPTDICGISVAEENLSFSNPTSTNAYSLSMGALTNGTGRSMNTHIENNIEDGESTQTAPATTTSGLLSISSTSLGYSRAPALSEPSVARNITNNSIEESIENQVSPHNLSGPFVVNSSQLVPLFTNLPKHRFSTEAKRRQREILKQQSKYGLYQQNHSDIFDTDDECDNDDTSSEAAVEALNSAAEAGEAWLTNELGQEDKKRISLSPAKSWFSFFHSSNTEKEDKQTSSVQSENTRNANHSSLLNLTNNDTSVTDIGSESSTEPVSVWRFAAVSAGFMTCASIFGLALILEAEVHSPIMATIRGHPWFLDFDSRFYRPMRSALLGFWRR
ncbi:unnamed protein product [Schistosoma margrebowiei]|uniref:FERM domain-containing protein n=1 Tax=Schistosoma margrebowiei TaxID=48269 RepID=A0AA85A5H2_9TREM|nr:unnamed protein product [Schistosoma margrebowiei]